MTGNKCKAEDYAGVLWDWKFSTMPEAVREIGCGLKALNLRTKY